LPEDDACQVRSGEIGPSEVCPGKISAATAGQMIIKSVVADESGLLAD